MLPVITRLLPAIARRCRAACLLLGGLLPLGAPAQPTPAPTDTLLLATGQEVRGRVLTITPTELTYLPAAGAAAPADTARLPTASVFLVRYANGTREVLAALAPPAPPPADPGPPALRGLSAPQRQQLGQYDAQRYYHANGVFWGTLGAALYLGPLFGLVPAIGIGSAGVRPGNLQTPQPLLLQDASYAKGYQQQANRTKRRRAWGGYGIATAVYLTVVAALVAGAP